MLSCVPILRFPIVLTCRTAKDIYSIPVDHGVLIDVSLGVDRKDRSITGIADMMVFVCHI